MPRKLLVVLGGAALGLVTAIGLGSVLGVALVLVRLRGAGHTGVEPSEKAMLLGTAISEAMNCSTAVALLLMPVGAFVAWRRARKGEATR